jgi:hypothetical protein
MDKEAPDSPVGNLFLPIPLGSHSQRLTSVPLPPRQVQEAQAQSLLWYTLGPQKTNALAEPVARVSATSATSLKLYLAMGSQADIKL